MLEMTIKYVKQVQIKQVSYKFFFQNEGKFLGIFGYKYQKIDETI